MVSLSECRSTYVSSTMRWPIPMSASATLWRCMTAAGKDELTQSFNLLSDAFCNWCLITLLSLGKKNNLWALHIEMKNGIFDVMIR